MSAVARSYDQFQPANDKTDAEHVLTCTDVFIEV